MSMLEIAWLDAELPADPELALLDASAFALAEALPLPKADDFAELDAEEKPPLENELEFALDIAPEEPCP